MLNLIHYVRQMTHIERLLNTVRLPMRSHGVFRIVSRNNRSGVIRVGKWVGIDLGYIRWKADGLQSKYPEIDVWIEATDGDGSVWMVEVADD